MKHFLKLICILLVCRPTSVHAQKENVVFPYSHDSLTGLLKDTDWLKASAEKYLQYINNDSLTPIVAFQSSAYTILDKNEEGLKLISDELSRIQESELSFAGEKVLNSIMYGYYYYILHPEKNSYYNAVKKVFEKFNPLVEDREFMYSERIRQDIIGTPFSVINPADEPVESDANKILQFMPALKNLNRPVKVLNQMEMGWILLSGSERKIAFAIRDEQIKFANDQFAIINPLQKKYDSLWKSRLYHFSSSDQPQTIVVANFQVFDKDDFPASQIWVNEKEIPNNGLDDDRNGFIDDINGVMYIKNKEFTSVNVPLIREEAKVYYTSLTDRTVGFRHGTMTVELMLKDNPYVKIIGLEHNQYDLVWKEMQQRFTKDVDNNRKLIDSLIDLRLKIWKNLVLYCSLQR